MGDRRGLSRAAARTSILPRCLLSCERRRRNPQKIGWNRVPSPNEALSRLHALFSVEKIYSPRQQLLWLGPIWPTILYIPGSARVANLHGATGAFPIRIRDPFLQYPAHSDCPSASPGPSCRPFSVGKFYNGRKRELCRWISLVVQGAPRSSVKSGLPNSWLLNFPRSVSSGISHSIASLIWVATSFDPVFMSKIFTLG